MITADDIPGSSPQVSTDAPQIGVENGAPSRTALLIAWIVSGILIFATLGVLSIGRPQEARVLEVAREMIGAGWDGWMIPHANGQVRLHKPPLAYWVAALGFKVFGIHDWAGRVPFAIATWLTIGLTYRFGKELFNARAGFYAAAMLFGSILFSHFTRRAETDTLIILFVTTSIYCIWRAMREPERHADPALSLSQYPGRGQGEGFSAAVTHAAQTLDARPSPRPSPLRVRASESRTGVPGEGERNVGAGVGRQTLWLHALGAMLGLTIMAKGPPALFVVLFFVAIVWWEKRWEVLGRFFTRGAVVPMLIIAAPWWIYMLVLMGSARFQTEINNVVEGADHFKWFWTYFEDLAVATAPWCVLMLHAVVESIVRFKKDRRVQWPLIWAAAVFIPLCFLGNKQTHYLLPMLPALMLIAGWGADVAARSSPAFGFGRGYRWMVIATLAVGVAGVGVLVAVPLVTIKTLEPVHVLSASVLAVTVAGAIVLYRRRGLGSSLNWTLLAGGLLVSLLTSVYRASMREDDMRGKVAEIDKMFGPASYCVYEGPANLAICFYFGQIIPTFDKPEQLEAYAAANPNPIAMRIARLKDPPVIAPPGFLQALEVESDGRRYTFYTLMTSSSSQPATALSLETSGG